MVLVDLPGFYTARVHGDTRRTQMVSQQIGYRIVGAHGGEFNHKGHEVKTSEVLKTSEV
jgi:hypothetical protein